MGDKDLPDVEPPEPKKQERSKLDAQVSISFSPRKVLKVLLIIVVLFGVFVLGRYSGSDASIGAVVVDMFATEAEPEVEEKEVVAEAVELAGDTLTGNVVADEPEVIEEPKVEKPIEEPVEEVKPQEEPKEEKKELIITNYKKVAVSLDDVKVDWKETWGKILEIKYTIKNSEVGTVLPGKLIVTMEGYDYEKEINLHSTSLKIKAGESSSKFVKVPGGFAYNPATVGDLTDVQITAVLVDNQGRRMKAVTRNFDLTG